MEALIMIAAVMMLISFYFAIGMAGSEKKFNSWLPFILWFYYAVAITLIVIFLGVTLPKRTEEEVWKRSLTEENPYEMKVLYDAQEEGLVPYDTVYIKK